MTKENSNLNDNENNNAIKYQMDKPASVPGVFLKSILKSLFNKHGKLSKEDIAKIPDISVEMKGVRPNREMVEKFIEVCGFENGGDKLPTPFPETMFLTMMARIFVAKDFPLSPLGLVHIGQTYIKHKNLKIDSLLDLKCSLVDVTLTERGVELACQLDVMSDGKLCWEGRALFLSRSAGSLGKKKKVKKDKPAPPEQKLLMELQANTGRRFSKASSDYNPHHLFKLTAKMFGYKQQIAHGMWTLSRAIAELEHKFDLDAPYKMEGFFKLPIFLPGSIAMSYSEDESGKQIEFGIHNPKNGKPHMAGKVTKF